MYIVEASSDFCLMFSVLTHLWRRGAVPDTDPHPTILQRPVTISDNSPTCCSWGVWLKGYIQIYLRIAQYQKWNFTFKATLQPWFGNTLYPDKLNVGPLFIFEQYSKFFFIMCFKPILILFVYNLGTFWTKCYEKKLEIFFKNKKGDKV